LSSPTSDLDSFERELLGAIPSAAVPARAKDAIWPALSVQAAQVPMQRLSVFRRALQGGTTKAAISLPVVAALGAAAFISLSHSSKRHAPNLAAPTSVVMSAAPSPPTAEATAADVATPIEATPSATASASPAENARVGLANAQARVGSRNHEDDLGREVAMLARARSELRAGNARATLSTLAQMQNQFPDRAFGQERRVLGILAQNAIGNPNAARQAAAAFVKAHPESPHAAELRHILEQD
jgi:hypothetical protein